MTTNFFSIDGVIKYRFILHGFYFLGEKGNGNTERGIYHYDMRTSEIETIFLQKEGFINNFTLISEPVSK
ncbi:hypothetical protein DN757_13325 [Paenibacillus silvae]|uniref:Uncharacterized protein n=1 Tax=Paenibacillus silvae TaxID=1325358 RepID=A0A2W6QCZ3_9BACL|nr:hypothetical protein DN757_13325 [Paenibacillus silvae]